MMAKYRSWTSLEPQFDTCNDIFSVHKIMQKLSCKHPQVIHSKLFHKVAIGIEPRFWLHNFDLWESFLRGR